MTIRAMDARARACVCVSVRKYIERGFDNARMHVNVCVCVCERERERERGRDVVCTKGGHVRDELCFAVFHIAAGRLDV